ncbi:MAG TPA: glycosyltransferase family 4 protein [Planctomycetaceae bacterium]|nr:glycosyltransferase family 4 protein [Planctomycetaceae bacterium]
MKVVHVITRLIIGGAQENTLLTCEGLHRDYGDDVTLISGPALGPEGSLVERAECGGYGFRLLPDLRRAVSPGRDWTSYRELVALFRELRPEIVHTHSSKAGILGRAAAARLGIPAVHTVHGPSFHPGQPWAVNRAFIAAERWAARRSARLISVADAMTTQYLAAGIGRPDQYVTIYSGMDVEPFLNPPRPSDEVRRELGFGPEHVVVGKVARLFHLKGHEDVVEAAARVIPRVPQARFVFVGEGILRERIQEQIARHGLSSHFVFTGLVPPERIPELVGAMDLVVHASLREGLARVLPQALIAGKPVVTWDIDGAREVAVPGETGFLLPAGAVDQLADAIGQLAGDPELRRRLGQNGRERFIDRFRHQTMTRRIREVYEETLSEELCRA